MKLLECGQIVSTHGIHGEMRVNPWCDSPDFLLQFQSLYLTEGKVLHVKSARVHKNCVNIMAEEVSSIDEAMPYINKVVYIDREEIDLPKGTYFVADLMDVTVIDADSGICYGKIVDVFRTGANDVYTIRNEQGKDILVPALKDVVLDTDIEKKLMKIRPLKGLFDE